MIANMFDAPRIAIADTLGEPRAANESFREPRAGIVLDDFRAPSVDIFEPFCTASTYAPAELCAASTGEPIRRSCGDTTFVFELGSPVGGNWVYMHKGRSS